MVLPTHRLGPLLALIAAVLALSIGAVVFFGVHTTLQGLKRPNPVLGVIPISSPPPEDAIALGRYALVGTLDQDSSDRHPAEPSGEIQVREWLSNVTPEEKALLGCVDERYLRIMVPGRAKGHPFPREYGQLDHIFIVERPNGAITGPGWEAHMACTLVAVYPVTATTIAEVQTALAATAAHTQPAPAQP